MTQEKRKLSDIINYATAPLVQWEPVVGESLSVGKRHEDYLTHSTIERVLTRLHANDITGLIADEGRFELYAAECDPSRRVNLLTLSGKFEQAARHNVDRALQRNAAGVDRINVTTDIDAIAPHSQDAVVMNMILGCLATSDNHDNLHKILCFASSLLKPDGKLITVRPNPVGGEFSTYACTTPYEDLEAGKDYGFIVKGLEDYGTMCNLYTPNNFMCGLMDKSGFDFGETIGIKDHGKTAFLLNVSTLKM